MRLVIPEESLSVTCLMKTAIRIAFMKFMPFFFHKLFGDMEIRSLLAAVVMFSYHIAPKA